VTGTVERAAATTELKKWPLCSETTLGHKNVELPALVDKSKIYLPQMNIKLCLIKLFVKPIYKKGEGFGYLRQKLSENKCGQDRRNDICWSTN
jgi:hypothetical protein